MDITGTDDRSTVSGTDEGGDLHHKGRREQPQLPVRRMSGIPLPDQEPERRADEEQQADEVLDRQNSDESAAACGSQVDPDAAVPQRMKDSTHDTTGITTVDDHALRWTVPGRGPSADSVTSMAFLASARVDEASTRRAAGRTANKPSSPCTVAACMGYHILVRSWSMLNRIRTLNETIGATASQRRRRVG